MRLPVKFLMLLPMAVLCSCTLGPDYVRPELDEPGEYLQQLNDGPTIVAVTQVR